MKKQRMHFKVIIKEKLPEIKEGLNLCIEREHSIPGGQHYREQSTPRQGPGLQIQRLF